MRAGAAAGVADQRGEQALDGEHGGAGGGVVDGQAARFAVPPAVDVRDAADGLDGRLVGGVRARAEVGPGEFGAHAAGGLEAGRAVGGGILHRSRAECPQVCQGGAGERGRPTDAHLHGVERPGRQGGGKGGHGLSSPAAAVGRSGSAERALG